MKRLSDHDSPNSWGPQSTAIPVGGTIAWMIGAGALLFGVAYEVPEVRIWATIALPASLVISIAYVVVKRWRSQPPTSLHLNESQDHTASETGVPVKERSESRRPFHDAIASC
ncbi:hypothetical protein [Candidatus Korobacter versatilis]|nr:hypothetical protein [Candidatus Koribacter versatilis]